MRNRPPGDVRRLLVVASLSAAALVVTVVASVGSRTAWTDSILFAFAMIGVAVSGDAHRPSLIAMWLSMYIVAFLIAYCFGAALILFHYAFKERREGGAR
jgi:phosphate/sulfate permease